MAFYIEAGQEIYGLIQVNGKTYPALTSDQGITPEYTHVLMDNNGTHVGFKATAFYRMGRKEFWKWFPESKLSDYFTYLKFGVWIKG